MVYDVLLIFHRLLTMPYNLKDPIRPKFTKKNYNVRDWATYDKGLKSRGSLTVWFSEDAIAQWNQGSIRENETWPSTSVF